MPTTRTATTTKPAEAGPAPQIETRTFTEAQFLRITRSANFIGAFAFWSQLQRTAEPGERTRRHADGILRALAESQFRDWEGIAVSPQLAEIFRRYGFEPVLVMAPAECALPGSRPYASAHAICGWLVSLWLLALKVMSVYGANSVAKTGNRLLLPATLHRL